MKQPEAFGKFVLLGQVAVGGMAEIYKARYADPAQPQYDIAIKRILPSYTEDESFVTMFKDEGNIALRLQHPNIVRVYEVGAVKNDWYIAMEFVHGTDLRVLSDACEKSKKRFTPTQVARIICETARALDYAHTITDEAGNNLNIVHRDCTPHNIMVTFNGEVKLMDFGIAKAASRATKTRVGTVKGKSSYMSPEQARGKNLDGRSDMFTLGTVAWELLTNHRLFKAASDLDAIGKILKTETLHPSDIDSKIPRELGDIILTTLEKDREARYANCGEFADALDSFLRLQGDGSDDKLGLVVQQLLNKNGHRPDEIPDYVPGESLFIMDDQGNFHQQGAAPSPAIPAPQPVIQSSMNNSMIQGQRSLTGMGPIGGNMSSIGAAPGAVFDPNVQSSALPQKSPFPVGMLVISIILLILGIAFAGIGFSIYTEEPEVIPEFSTPTVNLQLKTTPAGATVYINDEKQETKTPLTCEKKIKLGETVKLRFEHEGYETVIEEHEARLLDQKINVDLQTPEEAKYAKLGAMPEVNIKVSPENAKVTINGETKGEGNTQLQEVKFGETLKIEVAADGYESKSLIFVASKGVSPEVNVSLRATKTGSPQPKQNNERPIVQKTTRPANAVKKQPTQQAAATTGTGTVVIKTKPWSIVSIDGTRIGNTPQTRTLKAGSHKIELIQPGKNKRVSKTVTVTANKTVEISYDFNADK